MFKLRRLKIDKFRNVKPCTLTFDDGVNVLLGKNGTGKTTLLHLISAICRSDLSDFVRDDFSLEFDVAFGESLASITFENRVEGSRSGSPTVAADQSTPPASQSLYVLRLTWSGGTANVEQREGLAAVALNGRLSGQFAIHSPFSIGHLVSVLSALSRAIAAQLDWLDATQPVAFRFDESLLTFWAMTPTPRVTADRVLGSAWPAMLSAEWNRSNELMRVNSRFLPVAWVDHVMVLLEAGPEDGVSLTPETSDLNGLSDWAALMGAASILWRADQPSSIPSDRGTTTQFTQFSFAFVRRDGTRIPHELLSYGQKRMLALLYYMAVNEEVLIADEVVNGLHHEWIEAFVDRIGHRQAFLTSQNPLLFDFLRIDSPEQAARMFVVCTASEDGTSIEWRNMTAEEGRSFHEDLTAGAQYASELLLQRGLW